MHSILVKDYMDKNPHAIKADASVHDAINNIVDNRITGAPVIDNTMQLVGFISEHDCIGKLLNDVFYRQESVSVSDLMHKDAVTVTPETSILEVAESMMKGPYKNYPVVDGNILVGFISREHVLKALLSVNQKS